MFFNNIGQQNIDNDEYYNLLGVDKNADKSSIKKAYHKLAVKHHPDKGGDPDKFKLIAEAFEVLSDPEKKKLYDSGGKEAINGQGMSNPMDMFSQMFSGNRSTKRKGKNTEYTMNITLEDVYNGRNKSLSLTRTVIDKSSIFACLKCNGQGMTIRKIKMGPMTQQIQTQCNECNGLGSKYKSNKIKENIKIYVPKGVCNNKKIVVDGKGEDIINGESGDLIVKINIVEHHIFKIQGNDLFIDKYISLLDSISGLNFTIKHIDGRTLNVKCNDVIKPTLFDPFLQTNSKWETLNNDCKLEPYANAEINDVEKIKDIITNGQLKDQNINAFSIKDNSTYFYKQSINDIKNNLVSKDNTTIYIKQFSENNMYCIEGEGLPLEDNNFLKGDLYIDFIIDFPDKIINNELKEILIKNNFKNNSEKLNEENEEFDIMNKNPLNSYEEYKSNLSMEQDQDDYPDHEVHQQQCAQQ